MSLVKIQGNASGTGTLTIAAPNTNSDLTLNLPTTLGSSGISALVTTDASGNASIGATSSYGGRLTLLPAANPTTASASTNQIAIGESSANSAYKMLVGYINIGGGYAGSIQAIAGGSGTNLLINADGGTALIGRTTAVSGTTRLGLDATAFIAGFVSETGPTTSVTHGRFYNGNGNVGNISTNGSATTYSTSSDYRLKHDIAPMVGALDRVAALKPVTYKWNADESVGEGFIAHELQAVVPDAVVGEKDAVDADNNPVYQGIDTSFLVATLTAAIQELKAIVDAQGAEIAALKGTA